MFWTPAFAGVTMRKSFCETIKFGTFELRICFRIQYLELLGLTTMKEITEVQEEARRCVKCGNCLAQCPVYAETLEEPLAARGKMALVESLKEDDPE